MKMEVCSLQCHLVLSEVKGECAGGGVSGTENASSLSVSRSRELVDNVLLDIQDAGSG